MKHIDPIAQLMQEHDDALLQLSKLRKATKAIAEKGFSGPDYTLVLKSLKFIEEEVGIHNKSEEEALFPVLERYVEGPTKLMREDHKIMKKEFRKLHSAVVKVGKQKENKKAAKDLEEIARSIIHRFVNHIHKENHILFPLVQKFLTKDALREVARRML
jgi:uncharacterized protein